MTKIEFYSSTFLLVGKTRSGKTTLFKKLVNKAKYDIILVITTTPHEYTDLKNVAFVEFEQMEDTIELLMTDKFKKLNKCIVVDNFIGMYSMRNSKIFERLYTSCRHHNISVWTLSQMATKLCPTIRENSLYTFILTCGNNSYEKLFDIQNKFSKKKEWLDFVHEVVCDYPILIDNYDVKLKDNVFKFKIK